MTAILDLSSYGKASGNSYNVSTVSTGKSATANTNADLTLTAYNGTQSKYVRMVVSSNGDTPKLTMSSSGVTGSPNCTITGIKKSENGDDASNMVSMDYVDSRVSIGSYLTAKGVTVAGSGSGALDKVESPDVVGKLLISDITTSGNTTGLKWDKMQLTGDYISNVSIAGLATSDVITTDGTNWINSNRLTTDEANITELLLNAWPISYESPVANTLTISYDQNTYPIINSTPPASATVPLTVDTTGGDVTYSNTDGTMTLTNNGTTNTSWMLSTSRLAFWYIHNIVMKVCRVVNQIALSGTTMAESSIKIADSSAYSIQNSDGSRIYMSINTVTDVVTYPLRRYTFAYLEDSNIVNNIAAPNTKTPAKLGTNAEVILDGNVGVFTYSDVTSRITWVSTGNYRVSVNVQYLGISSGDFELLIRNPGGGSTITNASKRITAINGVYGNITIYTIPNITIVGTNWEFVWLSTVGNVQISIISWNITAVDITPF